jgi:hypothetical protein
MDNDISHRYTDLVVKMTEQIASHLVMRGRFSRVTSEGSTTGSTFIITLYGSKRNLVGSIVIVRKVNLGQLYVGVYLNYEARSYYDAKTFSDFITGINQELGFLPTYTLNEEDWDVKYTWLIYDNGQPCSHRQKGDNPDFVHFLECMSFLGLL